LQAKRQQARQQLLSSELARSQPDIKDTDIPLIDASITKLKGIQADIEAWEGTHEQQMFRLNANPDDEAFLACTSAYSHDLNALIRRSPERAPTCQSWHSSI